MLQKRFSLPYCLVIACMLLALMSFLPATASAATRTPSSIEHSAAQTATLAPAGTIHRVSDSLCASRTDFFKLWNGTTSAGGVCFASNGHLFVNIYNVYKITSGNNAGFVVDHNGDIFSLCQGRTLNHFIAHVTEVSINGRTC